MKATPAHAQPGAAADAPDRLTTAAALASTPQSWTPSDRAWPSRWRAGDGREFDLGPSRGNFAALADRLQPGLEVIVERVNGGSARGWVAAATPERIVLVRRSWRLRREELVLGPASLERLKVVDRERNGAVIGAVACAAIGLAAVSQTRPVSLDRDIAWLLTGVGTVAGATGGALIDGSTNRTIFERSAAPRLAFRGTRSRTLAFEARLRF